MSPASAVSDLELICPADKRKKVADLGKRNGWKSSRNNDSPFVLDEQFPDRGCLRDGGSKRLKAAQILLVGQDVVSRLLPAEILAKLNSLSTE